MAAAVHGHLHSSDPESCPACVIHQTGGAAPEAVALPLPTPALDAPEILPAPPPRSRVALRLCFETGPPQLG